MFKHIARVEDVTWALMEFIVRACISGEQYEDKGDQDAKCFHSFL
jgi:hypothetical protein